MKRARGVRLAVLLVALTNACNLNPQPLPPGASSSEVPAASSVDGGARELAPVAPDAAAVATDASLSASTGVPPFVGEEVEGGGAEDAAPGAGSDGASDAAEEPREGDFMTAPFDAAFEAGDGGPAESPDALSL